MVVKYRASYSGIGEMLRSEFMQTEMHSRIGLARDLAVAIAPVYEAGPHPGRYKAAFTTKSGVREGRKPRAFGRLTNHSPEALSVEFGTMNNPARHILVRALDATGGKGTHGSATVARRDGQSAVRQAKRAKSEAAKARRAAKKKLP